MLLEQCRLEMKRCKAVEENIKKKRGASKHLHIERQVRRFRFYTVRSLGLAVIDIMLEFFSEVTQNGEKTDWRPWLLSNGDHFEGRKCTAVIKWRRSLGSLWSETARIWYLLVARRELGGLTAPLHPTPCALG